jgi:Flp pilus assembly protein TadB
MSTNERLEKTVRDKPFLQHVLDLRIVARAVLAAVVAALLFWLLVGPATAGFVLLLVFFGSWFALARVSYDRRRESEPADGERSESAQGEGQPAGAG